MDGFNDVRLSLNNIRISLFLAWSDTKARYRRSLLGPLWMVLSSAISIAGLGFLWSILFKQEPSKLVPSLTVGLIIWQFLSSSLLEAPSTFVRNAHFIRNMILPYTGFILHQFSRQLINLSHNLIVLLVVLYIFPPEITEIQLLVIPGFIIVALNLLWMSMLFSTIGSRFRDFEQVLAAVMPLFFFISPVIFRPSQLSIGQELLWLNPFSYFITLIRDPIMGAPPPAFVYVVSLILLCLGWAFSIYMLGKNKKYFPFWI